MTGPLPEFAVELRAIDSAGIDLAQFGSIREAASLRFGSPLRDGARNWCLAYEEILRRVFRECRAFRDMIFARDDKVILNSIDEFTSTQIAQFLDSPSYSHLRRLFDLLRHFRGSPDIIALIVCRNRGIDCRRIVSDAELVTFCQECAKELFEPFRMPTTESRRHLATFRRKIADF
jgi:hypothetical protein